MSAALQLVDLHAAAAPPAWLAPRLLPEPRAMAEAETPEIESPVCTLAFYRKHTEKMLRRYLYASMLVGRAPYILKETLNRGLVSSRPVRSFEDAVIFVLDMETGLARLTALDRLILGRIVLQEYTHTETALMLGIGTRAVETRLADALDRLTRVLLDLRLLVLPF